MTARFHKMPFGARVEEDGRVRFSLWAPAAAKVELAIGEGDNVNKLPMENGADGFKTVTTPLASAGTRYGFIIDGGMKVPDPASRWQPGDVHGESVVVDPRSFNWRDDGWKGRLWEETVIYELHIGTFTREGTYAAAKERLGYLADLGVTAVELMPVADFPGKRGWGYDGAYLFAPEARYGTPDDLKDFVQAAHEKGLMVFLDVVYNHFGPEGNYLHLYAPQFFTDRHKTLWGSAINFDGDGAETARSFFIHNALYWIEEYHLDGLRLDSVHAIFDSLRPDIIEEMAEAVKRGPGAGCHVHIVLENDNNAARYLERDANGGPLICAAQWNDDIHHVLHVLITGETGGYYIDYAKEPSRHLGRCLAEGFDYQGEPSEYRGGVKRGEPSAHLPASAFVSLLQNHDQTGNRAFGERITMIAPAPAVRAATAVLLLSPSPPLLFMGQEWASLKPFMFFCDFGPDLAGKVAEGRRAEFSRFPQFSDPASRERIPDPNIEKTFTDSILDWERIETYEGREWLDFHRELLAIRKREIIPRLFGAPGGAAEYEVLSPYAARVRWILGDGSRLHLVANLSDGWLEGAAAPRGRLIHAAGEDVEKALALEKMPPWSAVYHIEQKEG